ncbi:MAG: hypothetical protein RLZZ522_1122 [Verrucomicrobiota bacterium]
MRRWCRLAVLGLALLLAPVAAADDATDDPFAAPQEYAIPSSEELGSSEQIINYRQQFEPTLYQTEWPGWPWLDLGMLAALLILGAVMVWRHAHFRWFGLPAALTLLYFGFVRGGCICPVGAVANMATGLAHPERIGVFTALMFLLPLVAALLVGRVFCVAGCPLGAVQHLLGGRFAIRLPAAIERWTRWLPLLALLATAWLAVRGACMLVCILDPYKTLFFFGYGWLHRLLAWTQGGLAEPGWFWVGDLTAWGIFAVAIAAGLWVYRPFCRFVCPYGVLLGAFAAVAFKRRRILQANCVHCGICEKRCPVNAITRDPTTKDFTISAFHCIQCNRCTSLCRKSGIS